MSYLPEGARSDLARRVELCPEEDRSTIRSKIASAAFRSLTFRNAQIKYLREQPDPISVQNLVLLFTLSKSTISDIVHGRQPWEDGALLDEKIPVPFSGNRQILTNDEERVVLDWIRTEQNSGNCPTPRDVRVYAQSLAEKRTEEEIACTADWWKSFKRRHNEEIETRRCTPLECGRAAVSAEDVCRYFTTLRTVLQGLKTSEQLLNMDETGNSVRPDKGRPRRVVCSRLSTIEPHCRDARDVTHVSLVGTVSLSGQSLKPFLVTISRVRFRDSALSMMRQQFGTFETNKGYMTAAAMAAYLREVIEPYPEKLRREQADPALPIYLLMDNHDSHNRQALLDQMSSAKIVPIWLPAHSTHFLQVLDVGLFGAYKTNYRNGRTKSTKPKLEGKMLRVLKAWHITTWPVTIWNAWRASGVQVTTIHQVPFHVSVDLLRVKALVLEHCHDGALYIELHPEWN